MARSRQRHQPELHRPRLPAERDRHRDGAARQHSAVFPVGELEHPSGPLHVPAFRPTLDIDPLTHCHSREAEIVGDEFSLRDVKKRDGVAGIVGDDRVAGNIVSGIGDQVGKA